MGLLRAKAWARTVPAPEPGPQVAEPGGWGGADVPAYYDPGAPTDPGVRTDPGAPTRPGVPTGPAGVPGTPGSTGLLGSAIRPPGEGWLGREGGEVGAPIAAERPEMEYIREVVPPARQPAVLTETMSEGEGTELPHWADPPTGEVPRALAGPDEDDEMQAWRLLGSRGLHWRDDVNAWSNGPGVEELADDDDAALLPPDIGGDPFSFDEDFERLERERSHRTGPIPTGPVPTGTEAPGPPAEVSAAEGGGAVSGAGSQSGEAGTPALDVFPPTLAASQPLGGDEVEPSGSDFLPEAGSGPEPRQGTVGTTGRGMGGPRLASPGGRSARGAPAAANGGPALGPGPHVPRHPKAPYDAYADAGLGGPGRNVGAAVVTGAGLIALFVVCYLIGPVALLVLSAVAVLGCALEAFSMVQEVGFRPATLVGALGAAGAVLAAYWKGTAGLPVVVTVVLVASFVWYLARVVEARPVVNAAVTFLVFSWVGVLGSFAGLLLAAHKGSHLFLGAVVPTAACDIAAWFAGSRIGAHQLAPHTSPGKTWEGVIAGAIVAVIVGAVIGHELSPWGGLRHGVELGIVIAIAAPVGDLVQSMVKRDLHLKDSGALLPGHGGLLDRFDSMLFVLPAVYFLAIALHLAG